MTQANPSSPANPFTSGSTAPLASGPVRATRALALTCLICLIVLGVAWELWLAPVKPGGSLLALKVLPLCIPLAGILRHRMYTYRWLSLLVWVYFAEGCVRAYGDRAPSNYLALAEVVLCLGLFVACSLHVRWRLAAAKRAAAT